MSWFVARDSRRGRRRARVASELGRTWLSSLTLCIGLVGCFSGAGGDRSLTLGLLNRLLSDGLRMERSELAKALLEEIVRTREQLARLQKVVVIRTEERNSGMDQCDECQRLWQAYQQATIQAVQLDEEIRSMTEDQDLQKFSEVATKAEAAERLRAEARQQLAEHQATTGHR